MMHYSNGNYEAFARPRKPKGVENKTAWFVRSGLEALEGTAFLIRDGQMPGNRFTILEQQLLPGGALEGIKESKKCFVIRGGREMESNFECLWGPCAHADGGRLHTAQRRARRAAGIQLHLRDPHAPRRDRPSARRQSDRHPRSRVPAQPADEEVRKTKLGGLLRKFGIVGGD